MGENEKVGVPGWTKYKVIKGRVSGIEMGRQKMER